LRLAASLIPGDVRRVHRLLYRAASGSHQRFAAIHDALAANPDHCKIKVGFAALTAEDSAAELIGRADAELAARARP
jgi:hypothetical protein